jgi:hypothetical protein
MVRGPILDSQGREIPTAQVTERTNLIGARNYRGGLPDADANLSFIPSERRGIAGLQGKFQEMMTTHVGIASAVYWAITEGAALPKEIVWPHRHEPGVEEKAFMDLCQTACIDDAVVYDGMVEGETALWAYPLLDAFMGFGLMFPRMLSGGSVEWYPVAHNAIMLWKPNGYLFGGARFSTPNGYDDLDAEQLVHTVHGFAGAGEFEGRSILRDCVQPFELWKQIAINAGVYNQLAWGFLDIAYEPSVGEADVAAFNEFGQQFQDGQRKYILRPQAVSVEMKYPSGSPPDVVSQLEYWDRQIEKKLNAPLAGITQFGSRAMAETLDGAQGRKAKAWINSIFDRQSRGMFRWLANQVGYDGRLPKLQVQSAELTTGFDGWAAYVNGIQAGLLTRGPDDEKWARRVIGAPELPVEVVADLPEPVGTATATTATQVLGMLSPNSATPLAPEAAVILLTISGLAEPIARQLVDAQTRLAAMVAAPPAVAAPAVPVVQAEGVPAVATPQVVLEGNVEVPAAIGEASAFAPVSPSLSESELAESDVNLAPTKAMAEVAARALEWRREHGRGGTEVGVARARDISNEKNLSPETVRRMRAYFTRHASDSKAEGFNQGEDGFPSAGRIAWDLWGGDAGAAWAERKVAELERASASSLAATLGEHPEVIVPDNVMAAAAAAILAHRVAGKARTTDSEALMLARDLAAGKRLAWSRVLGLADYFSKVYPRHSSSKSFADGGPSFHAYALRGGDAARSWVRSLLVGYATRAHRTASTLGELGGDLGDGEGEGVLVVGGDGLPFTTYRELRLEETVVGWVTLAETRNDLDARLAVAIDEISGRHRQAVISGLADGWQAGERDRIWATFVAEYQAALTSAAGTLRSATESEVIDEIKRSVRSGTAAAATQSPEVAARAAAATTAANAQFATAAAATQKAGEVIADRVQGEVEAAILAGGDLDNFVTRITIAGLVKEAAGARNMVASASRMGAYASAPAMDLPVPNKVIRSSIPDSNRCEVCAAADGDTYDVASFVVGDELKLPPLPDPNCEGRSDCRCGYIGVYTR